LLSNCLDISAANRRSKLFCCGVYSPDTVLMLSDERPLPELGQGMISQKVMPLIVFESLASNVKSEQSELELVEYRLDKCGTILDFNPVVGFDMAELKSMFEINPGINNGLL